MIPEIGIFESSRPMLLSLAYRMLGDLARAEEIVQNAWLRWQGIAEAVESPKAYLSKVVTNLCLNELDSARARREESRGNRLPEPVSLESSPLERVEILDQISMAFLVALQRLTPAERAVLLLHDVFEFSHAEIAQMVARSEAASRQLLRRAKENIAAERRAFPVQQAEHRRLLRSFLDAAARGSVEDVIKLLADDAVLIADAGPEGGYFGRVRNLPGPVVGAEKVARFVAAATPQGSAGLTIRECELNGQPSAIILRDRQPYAAMLISTVDGRIQHVFIQADASLLAKLSQVGL